MEVIILAGGLGTRLRSVVSEVPKCMATVAGKPFLLYLLKYLTRYDVSKVILSLGHLRGIVIEWIDEIGDVFAFIANLTDFDNFGKGAFIKSYTSFLYLIYKALSFLHVCMLLGGILKRGG